MLPTLTYQELEITTPILNAGGEIVEQRTRRVRQSVEDLGNGVSLELVEVPAGACLMGSRNSQGYEDERPQHRVSLGAFWMGKYPVTQAQWQALMGRATTRFNGPQRPIDTVSWQAAMQFCKKLSARTGQAYSLPSEAQWEYACRAGTTSAFAFGETLTTEVANYNGEFIYGAEPKGLYRHVTTDVGSFAPNAFGLHDMHGNVWEWCADAWHDSYEGAPTDARAWTHRGEAPFRAARGGCWHDTPDVCRSAARLKMAENEGDEFMGFRVVRPV